MSPIDPDLQIAAVRLAVSDLSRSVAFYEQVLGLQVLSRTGDRARLGPEREHPALELVGLENPTPIPPLSTGLFHVAWLHPSRAALAESVLRVASSRWPIDGMSDHGVSEAVYLSDPDGLGIEIYADRPREQWERPADGDGVVMVTLPLDLEDLLAQAPGGPTPTLAPGTGVGHVHLRVADVFGAAAFYRETLGLQEQARLPSAAFLAAGGYHHHVGLNSWQSRGGSPPPDSAPGLRLVEFALGRPDALAALVDGLDGAPDGPLAQRMDDGSLSLSDPDGHRLRFRSSVVDHHEAPAG